MVSVRDITRMLEKEIELAMVSSHQVMCGKPTDRDKLKSELEVYILKSIYNRIDEMITEDLKRKD